MIGRAWRIASRPSQIAHSTSTAGPEELLDSPRGTAEGRERVRFQERAARRREATARGRRWSRVSSSRVDLVAHGVRLAVDQLAAAARDRLDEHTSSSASSASRTGERVKRTPAASGATMRLDDDRHGAAARLAVRERGGRRARPRRTGSPSTRGARGGERPRRGRRARARRARPPSGRRGPPRPPTSAPRPARDPGAVRGAHGVLRGRGARAPPRGAPRGAAATSRRRSIGAPRTSGASSRATAASRPGAFRTKAPAAVVTTNPSGTATPPALRRARLRALGPRSAGAASCARSRARTRGAEPEVEAPRQPGDDVDRLPIAPIIPPRLSAAVTRGSTGPRRPRPSGAEDERSARASPRSPAVRPTRWR